MPTSQKAHHSNLTALLELLDNHVYGPYPEHIILHPDFPRPGFRPELHELQLHVNGEKDIIGFDDTEYITKPPPDSLVARKPEIMFFGILEIKSIDWLSEQGLRYLERDIKDCDRKIHMNYHMNYRTDSTLDKIIEEGKSHDSFLRVRICCRKNMLAHYLTSKVHYEKLIIYSKFEQIKRSYSVKSLHVACYAGSRNFLDRWRLRAAIDEMIQNDPDKTPLEERTISWAIKKYHEIILPHDKERRIVTDPGDNVEEPTAAIRQPRHLSTAEIRGYFAAHAEWLLAHQLAKFGTIELLNIRQWIGFCEQAHNDAIDASKHGVRWGLPHGQAVDASGEYDLAKNLAQFGEDEDFWRHKIRLGRAKKSKKRPVPAEEEPVDDSPEPLIPSTRKRKGIAFEYDSDFTDQSSSSDFTEDTQETPKAPPAHATALLQICLHAPRIPNGLFVWYCPVPKCQHQIDLMSPTPNELASLPTEIARGLKSKLWRTSDPAIQRALNSMVSRHYKEHCAAVGIQIEALPNGKCRVKAGTTKPPTLQSGEGGRSGKANVEFDAGPSDGRRRRSSRVPVPRRSIDC